MSLAFQALLCGASACAAAAPPDVEPETPGTPEATIAAAPETATELAQGAAEATRRSARSTAEWLARGVDSWFGNRPFEDGGKVTDGRLSLGLFKRGDESLDVDLRFNAHFRLPNIEHQTYVFVGRDDPREVIKDTPDALSRQQRPKPRQQVDRPEDRSFLAGLGASLPNNVDVRLGMSAHLKPYAQARYSQLWAWEPGQSVDFRETLFWSRANHLGSTTALSYEYASSSTLAWRWLNAATITQTSKNFEWTSSVGAYKSLGPQRLLSLEMVFAGTGTQGTGVGMSDLGLLAKWEQPIYKSWLVGEIVGGHFWPRHDTLSERGRAWALGGSLKMRF